jgi:uncharacterized protein RhaS with RHS repeats
MAETGLFQNHHRNYDPQTGRYIESDPMGLAGGINTYAYVEGNRVSYIDPLGLCSSQPSHCPSSYSDRYTNFVSDNAINVGPYALALFGGLWPKSWAPAELGRPPLLGSTNPLTSVTRALGFPGANSAIVRTGAAGIGLATVGIGFYDLTIELEGFLFAIPCD